MYSKLIWGRPDKNSHTAYIYLPYFKQRFKFAAIVPIYASFEYNIEVYPYAGSIDLNNPHKSSWIEVENFINKRKKNDLQSCKEAVINAYKTYLS